ARAYFAGVQPWPRPSASLASRSRRSHHCAAPSLLTSSTDPGDLFISCGFGSEVRISESGHERVTAFGAFGSRRRHAHSTGTDPSRPRRCWTSQRVSVVVARYERLRDAMIVHRWFEHHAIGELIDHAALDLLPRGLAGGIFPAAVLLERGAALCKLGIGD